MKNKNKIIALSLSILLIVSMLALNVSAGWTDIPYKYDTSNMYSKQVDYGEYLVVYQQIVFYDGAYAQYYYTICDIDEWEQDNYMEIPRDGHEFEIWMADLETQISLVFSNYTVKMETNELLYFSEDNFYVNDTLLSSGLDGENYVYYFAFMSGDDFTFRSVLPSEPIIDESPITTMFKQVKSLFMPLTEYVPEQVVNVMLFLLFACIVYFVIVRNLFRLCGSTKCIHVADIIFIALCIGAIVSTLGINLIGVIENV